MCNISFTDVSHICPKCWSLVKPQHANWHHNRKCTKSQTPAICTIHQEYAFENGGESCIKCSNIENMEYRVFETCDSVSHVILKYMNSEK